MLWIIIGLLASYLIGSIPVGYILGRLIKRVDIRNFGSGNIGATNASRVLGKGWGVVVLILDILKGFISVVFLGDILVSVTAPSMALWRSEEFLRIILGASSISGHNWTIFLKFRGGKGVATALGVLIGLSIKISGLKLILGLLVLTWIIVFLITRIVSIASVFSAVCFVIYAIIFKQSALVISLSVLFCFFAVIRHSSNLKRFLQGKEPTLF